MSFSVIVEGPVDGQLPGEEALSELQRYLRSTHSPQQLLDRLKSGKPFVIKKSLEYEQATKLCDRLFDFGLETFVDPPVKPEIKQEAPVDAVSETSLTTSKVANGSHVIIQPNNQPSKLSTGRPANPQQSKQTQTSGSTKAAAASHSNNVVNINGQRFQTKQSNRPSPQPANLAVKQTTNRSAAEVKAMFNLAAKVQLVPKPSLASRAKVYATATCSALVPILYAAVILSITSISLSFAFQSIGYLQSIITLPIAIFLVAIPLLAISPFIAILLRPLLQFNQKKKNSGVLLVSKQEPKLFMFVSALSQLLSSPPATKIEIIPEPKCKVTLHCTIKEFFDLRKPLRPSPSVSIGAPLLRVQSTRVLAAGLTPLLARYSDPKLYRAYAFTDTLLTYIQTGQNTSPFLSALACRFSDRVDSEKLTKHLLNLSKAFSHCESLASRYFLASENLINRLVQGHEKSFHSAQTLLAGENATSDFKRSSKTLNGLFNDVSHKIINKNPKKIYVNNLSDLIYPLYTASQRKLSKAKPQESETPVLVKDSPLSSWVNQTKIYCKASTLCFYQQNNLSVSEYDLISTTELAAKNKNDAKRKKAAENYFYKWLKPNLFWNLPEESSFRGLSKAALIQKLNKKIEYIRHLSADRETLLIQIDHSKKKISQRALNRKLAAASDHSEEISGSIETPENTTQKQKLENAEKELLKHQTTMGERIVYGLELWQLENPESGKDIRSIIQCLSFFDGINQKLQLLTNATTELKTLSEAKKYRRNQQYQLFLKELITDVEGMTKSILKRAKSCPIDFLRNKPFDCATYLEKRLSSINSQQPIQRLVEKSNIIERELNGLFFEVNEISAEIASTAEAKNKVEKIRVL